MGSNSTAALYAAFREYLSQCRVVGDRIVPPEDLPEKSAEPEKLQHGDCDWKRGQ